jgi:hypothetical protein
MSDRRKDYPSSGVKTTVPIFRIFLDINHSGQDIGANLATTKWELGELSFLISLWPGCARTVLPRRHPPSSAVALAVETGSHWSPGYWIKERGRTALVCAADCHTGRFSRLDHRGLTDISLAPEIEATYGKHFESRLLVCNGYPKIFD